MGVNEEDELEATRKESAECLAGHEERKSIRAGWCGGGAAAGCRKPVSVMVGGTGSKSMERGANPWGLESMRTHHSP